MKKLTKMKSILLFVSMGAILLSSCKKDDESPNPDPISKKGPIELPCDYFTQDRILVDDPDAEVDYLITCAMTVSNADIQIEPGVVIEFEQNTSIKMDDFNVTKSSLSANGTSEKPIIFRGVVKEKGYWRGIIFESSSPLNKLNYVFVEDAGGGSSPYLGGVIIFSGTHLKMENSTVSNSKANGLFAHISSGTIILNNNTFTGNKNPVYISATVINSLNPTNKFSGNEEDVILINSHASLGTISAPSTWFKVDVPYKIAKGSLLGVGDLLTVQPGVLVEFNQEFEVRISETGGLKAIGTADDPIIFSGISKIPKAWKGISIDGNNPENEIAFAEIQYSGLGSPTANVFLWYDATLNIHDVVFKEINGCGINHRLSSGGVINPNLTIGPNITVDPGGCIDAIY